MPVVKITNRFADRLRAPDPSGKQQLYWAGGTDYPGLGILVSGVSTTKSWVCQAKLRNGGGTRRVTLGPVAVLTLQQAWERAQVQLADLHAGRDPRAVAKQQVLTLRLALQQFLDGSPNLRPKTALLYRDRISRYLTPWLDQPMADITPAMVEARFRSITVEVQARAAAGLVAGRNVDGRGTANVTFKALSAIWNFCSERVPDLPRNPCWVLRRQWHQLERRTELVPLEKLPEFYRGVMGLESGITRDLIRLVIFTGLRKNEAAALKWEEEVDLVQRVIRLPAKRMKARQPFMLPMSTHVHSLLVARRALGVDGPYVFPGRQRISHCQSFVFALRQVARATGIRVSPHDLRRSFATVAAETEIPPVALKLLIAHTVGNDVTSGYVVLSPAKLREAAQRVGDRIAELCGIDTKETGAVPLRISAL